MHVTCPTCKTSVSWSAQSPFRPFCSKRCQLIDLGAWAEESHVISTAAAQATPQEQPSAAQLEEIEALLAQQPDLFFRQ